MKICLKCFCLISDTITLINIVFFSELTFLEINETSNIFLVYCAEYRQRGRLAGFSLYVSKTGVIQGSALCYKDGPQLPPLNFTTICTKYGRYVIFYNERLDGVKYPDGYELTIFTELCEVIVKGMY